MTGRLSRWILAVLVSIDQLGHVLLGGPKYILVGGPLPNVDETISSKVGRQAIKGKRWALVAEFLIDLLFFWQKDESGVRNHCRRMIGH